MAENGSHPPDISVSSPWDEQQATKPAPKINTSNTWKPQPWHRGVHTKSWEHRMHHSEVEWHIKWTQDCFRTGRVLIIDYISNEAASADGGRRHVAVAAQEFDSLPALQKFYSNGQRVHSAALRVIHVQNATWATGFLLRKFNIDHNSEMVGMRGEPMTCITCDERTRIRSQCTKQ